MKLLRFVIIVCFALSLMSCSKTILVKNYPDNAISYGVEDHSLTLNEIKKAIIRGAMSKGWTVKNDGKGKILATLRLRGHLLVVSITYDKKNYAIAYVDSSNLLYDGKHIHRQYANWIKNLRQAINANLASM